MFTKFCPDIHGPATTPGALYLFLLICFPPFLSLLRVLKSSPSAVTSLGTTEESSWGTWPPSQSILTSNEDQWAMSVHSVGLLNELLACWVLKTRLIPLTPLGSCCSSISSMSSLFQPQGLCTVCFLFLVSSFPRYLHDSLTFKKKCSCHILTAYHTTGADLAFFALSNLILTVSPWSRHIILHLLRTRSGRDWVAGSHPLC